MHKDDIPFRPIASNLGSACYPLNCFLVEIISPQTGKSSLYVKNSAHFTERISNTLIHSNQILSLYVVSRFTKVPTDETLAVIQDKLYADFLLEERTYIPLDNLIETTYFEMGSDIYRQEEGLAIGSTLSLVLANVYMELFEEMTLGSTSLKPSILLTHSYSGFIRKMFKYYWITWIQSDHLYSSLSRKNEIINYPCSM